MPRDLAQAATMSLPKLIAEVDRYRSLLQRLATWGTDFESCPLCGAIGGAGDEHSVLCPWVEVLREGEG
jgi:hypothetical protein